MIRTSLRSLEYRSLLHIAIGGGISFGATYFLLSIVPVGVRLLLFSLGYVGLLAFTEAGSAMSLFTFGTVFLPSGFFGGLYTGSKIKENLRIILVFPALIGFIGLIALRYFTGYINLSAIDPQNDFLIPILGNVVGSYLGGYAVNWEFEETARPSETIELDLSQVKS